MSHHASLKALMLAPSSLAILLMRPGPKSRMTITRTMIISAIPGLHTEHLSFFHSIIVKIVNVSILKRREWSILFVKY